MPIVKRIRSLGLSNGVLIPKPICDQFDWSVGTAVTLTVKGKTVIIATASPEAAKKAQAA